MNQQTIYPCRLMILIGILLLTSVSSWAQQPNLIFDQANESLANQQFTQAISDYQRLLNQNYTSGALHLNMAYCYVQLDSLGKAKYHLLKAERFDETREQANKSLTWLQDQFSRNSAVLPPLPWEEFISFINQRWSAKACLGLGLLLVNIVAALWVLFWLKLYALGWIKQVLIGASILALLITTLGIYAKYVDQRYGTGVMIHEETVLREAPAPDSSPITKAYEGYTFRIDRNKTEESHQKQWMYVRMSNGVYGWIPKTDILIL